MLLSIHMQITIMGDSWASGCWKESKTDPGRMYIHHTGINQLLTEQGHSVITLAIPGSHNHTQWQILLDHPKAQSSDLIVWLWTDTLRGYDWWQTHCADEPNLYAQQQSQEQWIQQAVTSHIDLNWSQFCVIRANAPLLTAWPCRHMKSWCESQGHIESDHATVDPVNWRDFVNWHNGVHTVGNRDLSDSDQFSHIHQMWIDFIAPFTHEHKAHHMEYLEQSQLRQTVLLHGPSQYPRIFESKPKHHKSMMGIDLHPNLDSHRWLTNWILDAYKND